MGALEALREQAEDLTVLLVGDSEPIAAELSHEFRRRIWEEI